MIKSHELYQKCIEAGLTGDQIDNHYSDLYIIKNSITTTLINDYEFKNNVTTFISETDKNVWYDIPFAYMPYWKDKH